MYNSPCDKTALAVFLFFKWKSTVKLPYNKATAYENDYIDMN